MLGILDCILRPLDFSKLSRTKLFARMGLADRTGITQSTERCVEKCAVVVYACTRLCACDVRAFVWCGVCIVRLRFAESDAVVAPVLSRVVSVCV